jgi:putative tryptophan/tyrosine transport system substrate-binding protein
MARGINGRGARGMGDRREGLLLWWSVLGIMVSLTCSLLTAPLPVAAQAAHVPRIGVLAMEGGMVATPDRFQAEFREALRERGYVEGQTLRVDYRWVAAGQAERLNDLAAELVRLPVDLIVAVSTPAAQAAKRATRTIPIVFIAGDPVGTGLVASLARPGGHVTGVSGIGAEIGGKCLEFLREIVPALTHVAVLVHATDPFARPFLEDIQAAAQPIGMRIHPVGVQGEEEFDGAFTAMVHAGVEAVIIQLLLATPRAAALAVQHRLPAIATSETFAAAGGLMAYGSTSAWRAQSVVTYVDKILKGAKPADLPVQRPMQFALVLNLKTAQALGLTIPPSLLFQADGVIQ